MPTWTPFYGFPELWRDRWDGSAASEAEKGKKFLSYFFAFLAGGAAPFPPLRLPALFAASRRAVKSATSIRPGNLTRFFWSFAAHFTTESVVGNAPTGAACNCETRYAQSRHDEHFFRCGLKHFAKFVLVAAKASGQEGSPGNFGSVPLFASFSAWSFSFRLAKEAALSSRPAAALPLAKASWKSPSDSALMA